ncbi:hypothetical protein DFJ73DRAFT_62200 [Zopfochytrium polystomum]|nr:hypothetical protein DFJ73DRAFT_62200 [Zopfochytrium polystomum]
MPVLGGRGRRRTCVAAEVAVTEAGGVPAPPGTVVETEKMVQTRCSNQFSVETLIGPKTAQEASAVPQARPESPAQVVEQESFDRKSFEDRDAGAFTQSPFLSNRESFREAFKPSPSLITLSLSSISPSFSAETWQEDPIIRQALRADAYALAVEREREGCRRFEGSPTPEIETNERII